MADGTNANTLPADDLEPIRRRWITPDYGMTRMAFSVAASSPISAYDLGEIAKADITFLLAAAEALASALSAARARATEAEAALREIANERFDYGDQVPWQVEMARRALASASPDPTDTSDEK